MGHPELLHSTTAQQCHRSVSSGADSERRATQAPYHPPPHQLALLPVRRLVLEGLSRHKLLQQHVLHTPAVRQLRGGERATNSAGGPASPASRQREDSVRGEDERGVGERHESAIVQGQVRGGRCERRVCPASD